MCHSVTIVVADAVGLPYLYEKLEVHPSEFGQALCGVLPQDSSRANCSQTEPSLKSSGSIVTYERLVFDHAVLEAFSVWLLAGRATPGEIQPRREESHRKGRNHT